MNVMLNQQLVFTVQFIWLATF